MNSAVWITDAERALGERPLASDDVDVLRGTAPPILDSSGFGAVIAPLFAATVWGAAIFREGVSSQPLDPLALLLRLVALGLTVRALLLGAMMVGRVRLLLEARQHALVLTPGGLLYRRPAGDVVIPRDDIVSVRERGDWRRRKSGRRFSPVFVITAPSTGRTHLALPPIFEPTPGILAERLMRWRGAIEATASPQEIAPHELASKVFDEAAAGRPPQDGVIVQHGRGWMRRGPYITVLASVAALDGLLRLPGGVFAAHTQLLLVALVVGLGAVPLGWLWLTHRQIAPRKGIALLLTPAEILMRTRAGILRTRHRNVARVFVDARPAWTPFEGYHGTRTLVIERKGQPTIRYDEAFLGIPAEVACALTEAYKRGTLPRGDAASTQRPVEGADSTGAPEATASA